MMEAADLASRRVQILASTPHPEVVFIAADRADADHERRRDFLRSA
jgi:hypothetical protein